MLLDVTENSEEIFPMKVLGQGGCVYERLGTVGDFCESAVYVPVGAAHASSVLGWRATYDANQQQLCFVSLSDAARKTWRLPAVSGAPEGESGLLDEGDRQQLAHQSFRRPGTSLNHFERTRGRLNVDLNGVKFDGGKNDISGVSGRPMAFEACRQECNGGFKRISGSSSILESDMLHAGNCASGKVAIARSLHLSASLSHDVEGAETPVLQNDPATVSAFRENGGLFSVSSELLLDNSHKGKNVIVRSVDGGQIASPYNLSGRQNTDILMARLEEEERVARCSCEDEEVNSRAALLELVQGEYDEFLLRELSAERKKKRRDLSPNTQDCVPVLEEIDEDGKIFLRNTRLSDISADDAETPLERLLYESSPAIQLHGGSVGLSREIYTNIYDQPTVNSKEMVSITGLDTHHTSTGAQTKSMMKTFSLNVQEDELLPSGQPLGTRRYQVEAEQRLGRRNSGKLDCSLDVQCGSVKKPTESIEQVLEESSDAFTRERKSLLSSFGTLNQSLLTGKTILKRQQKEEKNEKEKANHVHPQEQRLKQDEQQQFFQNGGRPLTVSVSPISTRSFLHSLNSPKLQTQQCLLRQSEKLLAEACEAKYATCIEALQHSMILYQRCIASGVQQQLRYGLPEFQLDNNVLDEPLTSSSAKYLERIASIKKLYSSSSTKKHGACDCRFSFYTPHAFPLPERLDTSSYVSGNVSDAPVGVHSSQLNHNMSRNSNIVDACASKVVGFSQHFLNMPCSGHSAVNRHEREKSSLVFEGDAASCTRIRNSVEPVYRRILTPPLRLCEKCRPLGDVGFLMAPVLCWDANCSANIIISETGTTCMADPSKALRLIAAENEQTGRAFSDVAIPMYAIGTIGISEGEFLFEVRIDTHPSFTETQGDLFAVGVTTKYYRGSHHKSPAYLFYSNGTIVASSDDTKGVSYGCSYHSGSQITVHLNLTRQELSFFFNGRPLGVAFRFRGVEDPEPLFPIVVLGREGYTASFVPPSIPQLPDFTRLVLPQNAGVSNST